MGPIPTPASILIEVVLCTILKSRSQKSCVALVVFFFSLVVVCINPVWADTTSGDPDSFAVYAAYSGATEATFSSTPMIVPASGSHVFLSISNTSGVSFTISPMFRIPEIVPVSYDRTLVLNLGVSAIGISPTIDTSNGTDSSVVWYQSSYRENVLPGGCWLSYDDMVNRVGKFVFYKITIPANATGLLCNSSPSFKFEGNGNTCGLISYGGYVVASSDRDVVNLVQSILAEVQEINGNLTSALTALNQILVQCQSIKADTSTIISVLGLCKDQLVTLNGKVDDIYKLLKDSLANEAGAVDKKSEQLAGQIMQRVDSEQYWSDKNTETFNALDMGNFTFGDGVVGALPTVGNLFKSLWDSFGDVTLIFTFPLMLGIALVIVGRVSRTAGKGSKKGGGDDG